MAYGRAGVYVSERLLPAPITAASPTNSIGCAVGQFSQGPITPVLVNSWYQFTQTFGGYDIAYPATFGVGQFFKSGGTQLYVLRVLPSNAAKSAVTMYDAVATTSALGTITANNPGTDGNNLRAVFTTSTQGSTYFNLSIYKESVSGAGTGQVTTDDVLVEQFNNVVFNNVNSSDYIVSVVNNQSQYVNINITDSAHTLQPTANDPANTTPAVLVLSGGTNGTSGTSSTSSVSGAVSNGSTVVYTTSAAHSFQVGYFATVTGVSPTGYNVSNALITAVTSNTFTVANTATIGSYSSGGSVTGTPPAYPLAADYVSALANLNNIESPLVIFAPELFRNIAAGYNTVHNALISYAESKNGFAVLETAPDLAVGDSSTSGTALAYAAGLTKSSYAAVYYPNIFIADPLGRNAGSVRKCGPAGAVAGLYLSTDRDFGPFKSPAGLRSGLGGVVTTEKRLSSTELDALNSAANPINAIRDIPGAGVVVMGARTLKQDGTANRYVSMRRSLIYLKQSLTEITRFALFENNDERLWAQLRTSISVFLNGYRNNGGLAGTSPDEAFYVKCDSENNTFDTIAIGEVHIEVGVSLEYPAEFVVITLSQKTAN
jgi:phage tail sheath protein FI